MIYILDASVITKWFVSEEDSEKALEIKENPIRGNLTAACPDLILYEIGNTLRFKASFTEKVVFQSLRLLMTVGLEIFTPFEDLLDKANHIAHHSPLTFYDSIYVALAEELKGTLITADRKLHRYSRRLSRSIFLSAVPYRN